MAFVTLYLDFSINYVNYFFFTKRKLFKTFFLLKTIQNLHFMIIKNDYLVDFILHTYTGACVREKDVPRHEAHVTTRWMP